jgi:hypothetical protein
MDQISEFFVPADGTSAAEFKRSGNFGTSPFYGQLLGKLHQLVYCMQVGTGHTKHNRGSRIYRLVRVGRAGRQTPMRLLTADYIFQSQM